MASELLSTSIRKTRGGLYVISNKDQVIRRGGRGDKSCRVPRYVNQPSIRKCIGVYKVLPTLLLEVEIYMQ